VFGDVRPTRASTAPAILTTRSRDLRASVSWCFGYKTVSPYDDDGGGGGDDDEQQQQQSLFAMRKIYICI